MTDVKLNSLCYIAILETINCVSKMSFGRFKMLQRNYPLKYHIFNICINIIWH